MKSKTYFLPIINSVNMAFPCLKSKKFASNTCIPTMQHKEIDEEQDICDVSSDYCLEKKEFLLKDKTINWPPLVTTGAGTSVMQAGICECLEIILLFVFLLRGLYLA